VFKKNVFRSRRNAKYDDDVLIAAGSAFRALAASQEMRCRRVSFDVLKEQEKDDVVNRY